MAVVNTLSSHATNDNDLVELAGYHSYIHYDIDEVFKVNEKKFRVIDTIYNTDTGLDALTVQKIQRLGFLTPHSRFIHVLQFPLFK